MIEAITRVAQKPLATAAVNCMVDWCSRFSKCQTQHLTGLLASDFVNNYTQLLSICSVALTINSNQILINPNPTNHIRALKRTLVLQPGSPVGRAWE